MNCRHYYRIAFIIIAFVVIVITLVIFRIIGDSCFSEENDCEFVHSFQKYANFALLRKYYPVIIVVDLVEICRYFLAYWAYVVIVVVSIFYYIAILKRETALLGR